MKRREQNLFLQGEGFTSPSKKWKECERNVNESEAAYHHDCDEAYEPRTTSEGIDSEPKLDRHALTCSLKEVYALRPMNATRAECSYASNEMETECSICKSICCTSEQETYQLKETEILSSFVKNGCKFLPVWYGKYAWIRLCTTRKKVFCVYCRFAQK